MNLKVVPTLDLVLTEWADRGLGYREGEGANLSCKRLKLSSPGEVATRNQDSAAFARSMCMMEVDNIGIALHVGNESSPLDLMCLEASLRLKAASVVVGTGRELACGMLRRCLGVESSNRAVRSLPNTFA